MGINNSVNSLSMAYMVAKTAWNVFVKKITPAPDVLLYSEAAYRPLNWSDKNDATSEIMMKVMSNINGKYQKKVVPVTSNINDPLPEGETPATSSTEEFTYGWFFDAFIRESHNGSVRITDHPVQGGGIISDHAYNLPDKLTIEIFVSDVMDSVIVDQFSNCETKSISAYETIRTLKIQRMPLSVKTRLHYYENMVIENISVNDDYKNQTSLRCTVMLREIIMAQVAKETAVSNRPYVNNTQEISPVQTVTTDKTVLNKIAGA